MTRRHGVIGGPKSGKLRRPVTKVNYPAPEIEVANPSVIVITSESNLLPIITVPEPVVKIIEPTKTESLEEVSTIATVGFSSFVEEPELKLEEEIPEVNYIEPEVIFGLKEEIKEETSETKEPVDKPKTEEPKEEKKWGRKKGWKKNK